MSQTAYVCVDVDVISPDDLIAGQSLTLIAVIKSVAILFDSPAKTADIWHPHHLTCDQKAAPITPPGATARGTREHGERFCSVIKRD